MVKVVTFINTIFFIVLCFSTVHAQTIEKRIASLEEEFKSFNYKRVIEKGEFLLTDPFVTKSDSLEIYQYMLSASYAIDDTSLARSIIKSIMLTDARYKPDPKKVSPKIIEFYHLVKNNIKPPLKEPEESYSKPDTVIKVIREASSLKSRYMISSILLPGSGHFLTGQKSKGYLFTIFSTTLMGAGLYTSYLTDQRSQDYLKAEKNRDFKHLYERYNSAYKWRNAIIAIYCLWNLYVQYDLLENKKLNIEAVVTKKELGLNIRFPF
ncbi:MAG: hypothetical protein GF313_07760 [Caldithrix sp.]|nr:hypothetical protein [Caldithrix sp.]